MEKISLYFKNGKHMIDASRTPDGPAHRHVDLVYICLGLLGVRIEPMRSFDVLVLPFDSQLAFNINLVQPRYQLPSLKTEASIA